MFLICSYFCFLCFFYVFSFFMFSYVWFTDLYCEPADSHQYLHYNSCHPEHIKKSSVYSQGLQIKRLCSDATKWTNQLKDLRSLFSNTGYPESMVKEQLRRVENRTRIELLCTNSCVGRRLEFHWLLPIIHTLMFLIK